MASTDKGTEHAEMVNRGPWRQAVAVKRAMCADGRRRYARITSEPDTFFSIPASVKVRGVSVSGFIAGRETDDFERDYEFIAYSYGKNGAMLQKEA